MIEGIKVGPKVIQDVHSSLFVLNCRSFEKDLWHVGKCSIRAGGIFVWFVGCHANQCRKICKSMCTRQQPAGFVFFHSNLILEDVTSFGCTWATPNPKITIWQQPKPKWCLWFKKIFWNYTPKLANKVLMGGSTMYEHFCLKLQCRLVEKKKPFPIWLHFICHNQQAISPTQPVGLWINEWK